jgi:hypothetical protein
MSLPKKKSRRIVIENETYRWIVSQDAGYISVTAQTEAGVGAKLEALLSHNSPILSENNSPKVTYGGITDYIVTPGTIAQIISWALENGWQPKADGPPFEMSWEDKPFIRRGGAT